MLLVNADLSSLEDKTKQCCIIDYDPEYVEQLNIKGYDAHLTMGKFAGMFDDEDIHLYKTYKKLDRDEKDKIVELLEPNKKYYGLNLQEVEKVFTKLDKTRSIAKTANYSATYGAGAAKIASSAEISLKEGKKLHKGYWDLNWSIKAFANDQPTKTVRGQNYIYSKYSGMWLPLRADHMKFSVINQNFGVTVFDLWCYFLIERGVKISLGYHDEINFYLTDSPEQIEWAKEVVQWAIDQVNIIMQQPIEFGAGPEFAKSYGDVH